MNGVVSTKLWIFAKSWPLSTISGGIIFHSLQWRHNERSGVSNHQPHDCLLYHLLRRRSKKASKLRITGLCAGNSLVTSEFPAQRASNAENVSIWWRHHDRTNRGHHVGGQNMGCRSSNWKLLYGMRGQGHMCYIVFCYVVIRSLAGWWYEHVMITNIYSCWWWRQCASIYLRLS